MKDEDIQLISGVLGLMTNTPVTSLKDLLNHEKFKQKVGRDRLGMAIASLKEDKLIDEIPKTTTYPIRYQLTAEGNRVKNLPGGYQEFVENKSIKEQQDMERQSMAHELTALQISNIKEEIELQITKQQNDFYQKSIEKLTNELDEKARAIEKELKLTSIKRNKRQLWTMIATLVIALVSLLIAVISLTSKQQ
ncbi:MAG: hypothetical protein KIPDCIKN_01811 [Haliscomenobacter sp.]|jgi:hypothetical protein|nr:hypothetical protein [Haliscomenobacter sp.]